MKVTARTPIKIMKLKEKLENWYRGKYIPPPENDPDCPFIVLSPGHYEK